MADLVDQFTGRYKDGWDPEKWEEEFEKHPIFMTKSPDSDELPPLVEAIQQLKYDPEANTKAELAQNYKEDGNENFKLKKYRWAIDSYTEGIKQNCEDFNLNSQLYANRAACHFHLQNYRSSLNDALKAIELNGCNGKAIIRVAESYFALQKYKDCIEFCKTHKNEFSALELLEEKALEEQSLLEKDIQRQEAEESKIRSMELALTKAVEERGISWRGSLFDSIHPAADGKHVSLNDKNELIWPVLFLYPEYGQTDFIERFNENEKFIDHFEVMFNDDNAPNWDVNRKYKPNCIKIGYQVPDTGEIIAIKPNSKLCSVLNSKKYVLINAIPTFECIKPVKKENVVGIHSKKKVEVTLGDCLACSGCITSAETVLIAKQSHKELYNVLNENKVRPDNSKIIVTSLSHQSVASLAAKYSLGFQETAEKLASLFVSIGVHYVFDLTLARYISLIESQKEFESRYASKTPILTSTCPGFVCYAEKTHGEMLVPYLSKVRSPQQIMGSLVKHLWRKKMRLDKEIYHVTVMPCYDKKLEASREEFLKDEIHDVDCVLTPVEIEEMLDMQGVTLSSFEPRKLNALIPELEDSPIVTHLGSGSGGFAENVYRFACQRFFKEPLDPNKPLDYQVRRNRDFLEVTLEENGKRFLSFAIVNGFRNIQTLVQRVKRKTFNYDYVEIMACPSGCLNGGGQSRGNDIGDKLLTRVEELYKSLSICNLSLDIDDDFVDKLYKEYFPNEEAIESLLHTKFRIIPKTGSTFNVTW